MMYFYLSVSCSDVGKKLVQLDVLCLLKVLSAEDSIFVINFEYKILVLYLKVRV